MPNTVILRGYRFSVYTWIARLALYEKGVFHSTEGVNPFDPDLPDSFIQRQPFRKVPVLSHGPFDIYETAAILRYVDAAFPGPALLPEAPKTLARVAQTVSILDSYGYRPMIRQVFAHRVFRPASGLAGDAAEVAAGRAAAQPVLRALNDLASEGHVLNGQSFTLADCHLAPFIGYFVQAPEGANALSEHPALSEWWDEVSSRQSVQKTAPGLPSQ